MKTPAKLQFAPDAPMATPSSAVRPTTRSSSLGSKRAPSPGLGTTPKKKIIKLTSKGKLLSSPASVSPASKRKTRSKQTQPAAKVAPQPRRSTRLSYGSDDESRNQVGNQIDTILAQTTGSIGQDSGKLIEPVIVTHPFFMGKPAKKSGSDLIVIDDESTIGQDSDTDEKPGNGLTIKPKDWNDLGFKKNQISVVQVVDAIHALWPPKGMQHVGAETGLPTVQQNRQTSIIRERSSKSRVELCNVPTDEDILHQFAAALSIQPGQPVDMFPLPRKIELSRQEMADIIMTDFPSTSGDHSGANGLHDAFPQAAARLQSNLLTEASSTDGQGSGTTVSWLSTSAPQQTNQVLQTQTHVLQTWLASHQVHHTATKLSAAQKVKAPRRRRRRKKAEDLSDFIAGSDEDEGSPGSTKNAILIAGPSGCGKTASVYAAAKELDFEVFEIYPGMRRSAKDIFDKVGDMTQNHLVHKATQLDHARDSPSGDDTQFGKIVFKTFLGGKKTGTKAANSQSRPGTPKDEVGVKPQSQKQSLILFEEVDILFEEDRGFWSGVIQLIELSKRPVILTCNDPSSVPVEDLPLHATLHYEPIPVNVAVDYILLLAASEGHWIQREAVSLLYLSKQNDLRATIAELSFWCQMAVGSEKAGLDWMVSPRPFREAIRPEMEKMKVFSKDTYLPGMGMVPRTLVDSDLSTHATLLQYAEDELGIPLQHWHEEWNGGDAHDTSTQPSTAGSRLHALQQRLELSETRSILDLLNRPADARCETDHMRQAAVSARIAASASRVFTPQVPSVSAEDITHAHLQANAARSESLSNSVPTAFEPLMAEKPRFPPSTGRLAPSLETSSRYLVADIAPYIRSIVRYDQRLQLQREAMAGGLQGIKTRKTRASRAALEGGSKASTREEKWFPRRTDYAAILQTGGEWHSWEDEYTRPSSEESSIDTESRTESTVASPVADVEMTDDA
jgi:sorting nexin-8